MCIRDSLQPSQSAFAVGVFSLDGFSVLLGFDFHNYPHTNDPPCCTFATTSFLLYPSTRLKYRYLISGDLIINWRRTIIFSTYVVIQLSLQNIFIMFYKI